MFREGIKNMFSRKFLLSGVAVAAFTPAAPVLAQGGDAADGDSRDVITVTARRREESLQDTPISITVMSGEQLEERNIKNGYDLQFQTPSLTFSNANPNRSSLNAAIRGQRTQETQILTDPPVGNYFAEVVTPRSFGFATAFYDLQNVQVLKGVQGTLFGRNMTGGALLIEPAHPNLSEVEARAAIQAGNLDLIEFTGMLNIPVVKDTFGLRVAGKYRDRQGYTTDVSSGLDFDDEHYYAFRVSAEFQKDNFTTYTVFDYLDEETNGTGTKVFGFEALDPDNGSPTVIAQQAGAFGAYGFFFPSQMPQIAAGAPLEDVFADLAGTLALGEYEVDYGNWGSGPLYPTRLGSQPSTTLTNWGITNKTTLELNGITFKNIFGYRKIDWNVKADYDGSPTALIQPNQYSFPRNLSEEFNINMDPLDGRMNLTLGAFYFREKGLDGSTNTGFPQLTSFGFAGDDTNPLASFFLSQPADFYELQNNGYALARSWAVYGALTFELTDTLSVAGGVRYNDDYREVTIDQRYTQLFFPGTPIMAPCAFNGLGAIPVDDCPQTQSLSNDAITWDATLQYEPTDSMTAYAAIRKGYRAGGFSLRASNDLLFEPFQPEDVLEYEVGMKNQFDFDGGSLRTSIAAFYQDYTNVQTQISLLVEGSVRTFIRNTAKQENYGGEIEAFLGFDNGLSASLGYSYVNVNYLEGNEGANENRNIPKHQVNGSLSYVRDIALGDLVFNVNASYQGDQFLDDYDAISFEEAYVLVNGRLGIANVNDTGFGIALFANNIFDEYYRSGAGISLISNGPVVNGVNPGGTVGYGGFNLGAPRTWGVEISYEF